MRPAAAVVGFVVAIAAALWAIHQRAAQVPEAALTRNNATTSMTKEVPLLLTSSDFENNGAIPSAYTCDGQGGSPQLSIAGVPAGAKSLALIVDDPDIPAVAKERLGAGEFVHWVLFDIPPASDGIPADGSMGVAGANSAGKNAWAPPCPPPQYEPSEHRYVFTLYALDATLGLPAGASRAQVLHAMEGHIVASTQLVGRYKRK